MINRRAATLANITSLRFFEVYIRVDSGVPASMGLGQLLSARARIHRAREWVFPPRQRPSTYIGCAWMPPTALPNANKPDNSGRKKLCMWGLLAGSKGRRIIPALDHRMDNVPILCALGDSSNLYRHGRIDTEGEFAFFFSPTPPRTIPRQ